MRAGDLTDIAAGSADLSGSIRAVCDHREAACLTLYIRVLNSGDDHAERRRDVVQTQRLTENAQAVTDARCVADVSIADIAACEVTACYGVGAVVVVRRCVCRFQISRRIHCRPFQLINVAV